MIVGQGHMQCCGVPCGLRCVRVQGALPGGTYVHPPFPAVRHLDLANNSLSGELPDALRYSGPFRLVISPLIPFLPRTQLLQPSGYVQERAERSPQTSTPHARVTICGVVLFCKPMCAITLSSTPTY